MNRARSMNIACRGKAHHDVPVESHSKTDNNDAIENIFHMPLEIVGTISRFLDVGNVRLLIQAFRRNPEPATIIRKTYLHENFHYLQITYRIPCWFKRKSNTLAWMECNDWKNLFNHKSISENISPLIQESLMKDPAFAPFLNIRRSIERGIVTITKFLIEIMNQDVNHQVLVDTTHFEMASRPLHLALVLPETFMLEYLLQLDDIDVNCKFQGTFGNKLLHYAAGDIRISPHHIRLLLAHRNLDVDCVDAIGKTPLHYVCWFLNPDCHEKASLLLQAGSKASAIDNQGMNALGLVTKAGTHRRQNVDKLMELIELHIASAD